MGDSFVPQSYAKFSFFCRFTNITGMASLGRIPRRTTGSRPRLLLSGRSVKALGLSPAVFIAAAPWVRKHRLASPPRSFYLILRPENRVTEAPNPVMNYLGLNYRISQLRAAALYGSPKLTDKSS